MENRKRSMIRVLIIVVVPVILFGAGTFAYLHRQNNLDLRALEWKTRGEQALRDGKHQDAIEGLGRYLRRFPDDVDALYNFATVRRKVAQEGNAHLIVAMRMLERVRTLQPERMEAQRDLLDLYVETESWPEALTQARKLLELNKNDSRAKWAELLALESAGLLREAFRAAGRYTDLEPDDLKGQLKRLALMSALGDDALQLVAYAREVYERDPTDPTYRLLLAHVLAFNKEGEEAKPILLALARMAPQDDLHSKILILSLKRLGLNDASRTVMAKAAEGRPDSPFHLSIIDAEWQRGDLGAVVERIQQLEERGVKPSFGLMALKIIALVHLEEKAKARAQFSSYEDEFTEPGGEAWYRFLVEVLLADGSNTARQIDACLSVITSNPGIPYVHFTLGRLYEEVAEDLLASQAYAEAYRFSPYWTEPLVRGARLLAASGGVREAIQLIGRAREMSPEHPEIRSVWEMVRDYMEPGQGDEMLQSLSRRLSESTSDSALLLPLKVGTEARLGNRERARELIREAIGMGDSTSEDLLIGLARISDGLDLGMSRQCLDQLMAVHGVSPSIAYYRATSVLPDAGLDAAAGLLATLRRDSDNPSGVNWSVAEATLLDETAPEQALAAWREVLQAEDAGIHAYRFLLDSRSAWRDPELIATAVERVRSVTGDSGLAWRLARSRLLFSDPEFSEAQAREVVEHLSYVLTRAPHMASVRPVLATAYRRLGDTDGAMEQLLQAASLGGYQAQIDVELASLSYQEGRYTQARKRLRKAAIHARASARDLVTASELLLLLNEVDHAQAALSRTDIEWGSYARKQRMLMARILTVQRRFEESGAIIAELLSQPDAELLRFAADLSAIQGRGDAAREYLARLGELDISAGNRALIVGEHYRRFGNHEEALPHFAAAAAATPGNRKAWLRYLSTAILLEDADRGIEILEMAAAALPEDPWLQTLADSTDLLRACINDPFLGALAAAWVEHPSRDSVVRSAIAMVQAFQEAPDSAPRLALQFDVLAASAPKFYEFQILALRLFAAVGAADGVLDVAERARANFPTRVTPSRIAAEFLAAADKPREALQAAEAWLGRSQAENLPAVILIAECQLKLGYPKKALVDLRPYLDRALADPVTFARLLTTFTRALVETGRLNEAEETLIPLLDGSEAVSAVWIQFCGSGIENLDLATRWLLAAEERITAPTSRQLFLLLRSWSSLAEREQARVTSLAGVMRVLEKLEARADLTAEEWFRLGSWRSWLQEPEVAKAHYLRAIELDDTLVTAKNNLSVILLAEGDAQGALQLARAAAESQPDNVEYRDSLAAVLIKLKSWEEARHQIRVCRELEKLNPRWPITLLEIHDAAGTDPDADEVEILFADLDVKYERPFKPDLWKRYRAVQRKLGRR